MLRKLAENELLRFVAVGGVNTCVTYVLFLGLCRIMPAQAAYTLTYLAGIFLSYALNSLFVFGTDISLRTALRFPLVYIVQYLYGLALLTGLTGWLQVPSWAAMAVVIVTSIPLTFVLSRMALRAA